MTQYVINIGAIPNDGTGDPLRTAFNETNLNFNQVFAAGPVLSNIQIANNAILTTNTNGNLVLAPNGTGVVQSNVSIVPNLTNLRNLGSATNRWNTVYTRYIDYVSGNITTDNITITGVLTAPEIVTNLIHSDDSTFVNIQDGLNVSGDVIAETVSATNIVVNNISSDDSTFVTIQDGLNVSGDVTTETVSAVGNVAGNYFIGNGSQLTGIVSSYGDANVAAYLPTYSGNISGGNIGVSDAINAVGEITSFANLVTTGEVQAAGNVFGNYFFGNAAVLAGQNIRGEHAANMGSPGFTELNSNVILQITGNANSYAQINFQNIGNGTAATTDYIATAQFGDDSTYFVDMGIASGVYDSSNPNNSLGTSLYAQDSYLYSMGGNSYGGSGGNLVVGTNEPGGVVRVIADGSDVSNIVATFSNVSIDVKGNIIPVTSNVYSLGNSTNQWSDLYVSNATIYMNNVPISLGVGNVLTVDGNAVLTNDSNTTISTTGNITADYFFGDGSQLTNLPGAGTGNVTFDNQIVIGTGDSGGGGGLYLAPGNTELANVQYFRVRGGDFPTHLHFDTGNNAYYDQYFGADNKFVKLEANGNIVINADDSGSSSATWTFDVNGTITLPPTSTAAIEGTDAYDVRIRAVSISDPVSASLQNYNGSSTTTSVSANPDTVTVNADNSNWVFDTTGNLTTPQGGWIGAAGVKGDGTMLTGGTGNITSVTSYYADAPGIYSSCLTANPGGTLDITTYGNGTGMLGQWNYANTTLYVPGNGSITTNNAVSGLGGNSVTVQAGAADQNNFNANSGGNLNLTGGTGGFNDDGVGGPGGNINITAGSPGESAGLAGNVHINSGTAAWTFNNNSQLKVANLTIAASNGIGSSASIVEDEGSLAVLATGTNGLVNIGWSDTTSLGNTAVMWFNEPGNDGNAVIRTGNTAATSYSWTYSNAGGLSLATVNDESAQFVGTRKIVNGALTGATAPYSVTLNTGGTPTVVYTSSAGVYSTKVTFVTQSTGAGFNWEQFDVVAVPSQDIPGEVNFVVSNRVKALSTVPDTVVTATINGSQIEISLTLDVVQGGGYASFDATEFGLMVD